jgi:hypothetical protein
MKEEFLNLVFYGIYLNIYNYNIKMNFIPLLFTKLKEIIFTNINLQDDMYCLMEKGLLIQNYYIKLPSNNNKF